MRRLRDGPGEILDRVIDIALAAVGLAAPEERVGYVRVDGERGVEIGERWIKLRRLDIGPRPPDIGRRQILAQGDGLVVLGDRLRPRLLVAFQIAAAEIDERIFGLEFGRAIEVGAREIEVAVALADIGAREQRRHELRIDLQRRLEVGQREVEFGAAAVEARTADQGLDAVVRRALRVIEHRRAGRLDLVGGRTVAVLQVTGAGRTRTEGKQQRGAQRQRG